MAYATYENAIARYPEFVRFGNGQSDVNSGLIHYAEVELDSRLAPYYTVPFAAPIPGVVTDLTLTLSWIKLLESRNPEQAAILREMFDKRIERIQEGHEVINTGSGTSLAIDDPALEIWSNTAGYNPVHSMLDAESPYTMVDSSLIYDEEILRGKV